VFATDDCVWQSWLAAVLTQFLVHYYGKEAQLSAGSVSAAC